MTQNILTLDVGGKIFKIKKDLLLSKSKYFESLFKDTNIEELSQTEIIYVDRSPHIFKHVLAYIRDPTYQYPEKYLSELDYLDIDLPETKEVKDNSKKYCSYCEYESENLYCCVQCARMQQCIWCKEWKDEREMSLGYCKNCNY